MKTNIAQEDLTLGVLERMTGPDYDRAEAYDLTRDMVLNGSIQWQTKSYNPQERDVCANLLRIFKDVNYKNKFSGLEFIGPVVLCDYRIGDKWFVKHGEKFSMPPIGANLIVRNSRTGKMELLNRNEWLVCREWLSKNGSMLSPFFKTMSGGTGEFLFNNFLYQASKSR